MRDHDEGARPAVEEVLQHGEGLDVEVVGGLVEQQHVGLGQQQPQQLEPAPLATGQVAEPRGEPVAGEAEPLQHRGRGDLAVRGPGDPPDRLDGVQHPRLRVELVEVLGQVLERDRAARAAPGRRSARARRRAGRAPSVLPAPFTPTSPTRSPGPSRQVACETAALAGSPRRRSTSSTSMTSLPSRWVANRCSSSRSRGGGHVLDQRVGGVDAELRLRGPRRRAAAQPGQLLADQVAAAQLRGRGLALPLGLGQDVRRVAALVDVDHAVVDLPGPLRRPRRGTTGRG